MLITALTYNFLIMLAIFLALWAISLAIKNASIVDIFWGVACAFPAVLMWIQTDGMEPRASLLTILVAVWGVRLASYLAIRNLGHGEDYRYTRMREKAGGDDPFAVKSLYKVFVLQCAISFFVSLPVQIGQIGRHSILSTNSDGLGVLALIGTVIFCIGLAFETVGDFQLRQFKSDPQNKGKLMDRGLWAWTRHPNYFGDAAVWVGLTFIALESQFGYLTLLSPALMVYFLYSGSGKALLERSMSRRYPEYEEYRKRVSGFFPLPPTKKT